MTVQTGPDRGTVLRSGLKIWDRTAYKSVQSGPVPVPRSGPVSLVANPTITALAAINPIHYATAPTAMASASYVTISNTIIMTNI